jgi:hypothetical protein
MAKNVVVFPTPQRGFGAPTPHKVFSSTPFKLSTAPTPLKIAADAPSADTIGLIVSVCAGFSFFFFPPLASYCWVRSIRAPSQCVLLQITYERFALLSADAQGKRGGLRPKRLVNRPLAARSAM